MYSPSFTITSEGIINTKFREYSGGTHHYHHAYYKAIFLDLLTGQGQLDWTIESVGAEWTMEVSQENVVPNCDGISGCTARYDGKIPVCSHAIIL